MSAVSGAGKGEQGERSPPPRPKLKKCCRNLVISSGDYTFGDEAEIIDKFSEKLF